MASKGENLLMHTHADTSFDPELYVSLFFGGNILEEPESRWAFDQLHDIFKEGKLKGKRLLDIGSGPVVYPVISASKWFDEVFLSDYSTENVTFLQRWMTGESNHMRPLMEYYAKFDPSDSWQQLDSYVRQKVKNAVIADVNQPDMLLGTPLENMTFDVITTCLCLHVAALTIEDFKKALQNIRKILTPCGHLVIIDILDNKFYTVGDKVFRAFSTTVDELHAAMKTCGFELSFYDTMTFTTDYRVCDATTQYVLVAKRVDNELY